MVVVQIKSDDTGACGRGGVMFWATAVLLFGSTSVGRLLGDRAYEVTEV